MVPNYSSRDEYEKGFALGVTMYVSKPFEVATLGVVNTLPIHDVIVVWIEQVLANVGILISS